LKDDEELSPDENERYEIDKDIVGNVKLTIKKADKGAEGKYACRIVGREKEKNCFTKSEFVLKGTFGGKTPAWSMQLPTYLLQHLLFSS
jgi:hypothetical protein